MRRPPETVARVTSGRPASGRFDLDPTGLGLRLRRLRQPYGENAVLEARFYLVLIDLDQSGRAWRAQFPAAREQEGRLRTASAPADGLQVFRVN